ncbi:MAG: CotH kinase family protein, partial [Eubacteriales bacterium]
NTTDRFSFRLKFDEYTKDQTCFGLDTFVINNCYSDNSYMKEYLSYDIMNYIGVDSPLETFTNVSVNGETWGLYLAVEAYNESFLDRTYDDITGNLYSVKGANAGGGMGGDKDKLVADNTQDQAIPQANGQAIPNDDQQTDAQPPAMMAPGNDAGGNIPNDNQQTDAQPPAMMAPGNDAGGSSKNGADLQYIDEDSSSYSSIFGNAVGDSDEDDQQRVITALKNLSEGTELEEYFDIDKILRYLAAHTFVVNLDSYSSNMCQNYYVYEKDGKISILPWDYNQSFGGFQSASAESVINFPIDTPVSGVELAERPLIAKLLENEEYLEKYHSYLNEIVTGYIESGQYENTITKLDNLINEYVKNDPSAFCTYEEYEKAVPALLQLGELRAESIKGQLNGSIPSTTSEQELNPEALLSPGTLNFSDLGSVGGGGGGNRNMKGVGDTNTNTNTNDNQNTQPNINDQKFDMPDRELIEKAMEILQGSDTSNLTEEQKTKLLEIGLTEDQIEMLSSFSNKMPGARVDQNNQNPNSNQTAGDSQQVTGTNNLINNTTIISILLIIILLFGTFIISRYKKKY